MTKKWLILLFPALFVFTSCGSSDDDDDGDSNAAVEMEGGESDVAPDPDTNAESGTGESDQGEGDVPSLAGTSWRVVSIARGSATITAPSGTELPLDFGDSTLSGTSACNLFSASYEQNGSRLQVRDIHTTLRGCDDASTRVEQAMLDGISEGGTLSFAGSRLTVAGSSGVIVLERR